MADENFYDEQQLLGPREQAGVKIKHIRWTILGFLGFPVALGLTIFAATIAHLLPVGYLWVGLAIMFWPVTAFLAILVLAIAILAVWVILEIADDISASLRRRSRVKTQRATC